VVATAAVSHSHITALLGRHVAGD
jgi:hypothetical protein